MGCIIASCGHKLTPEEDLGYPVIKLGYDGADRCAEYFHVCKKCLDEMDQQGINVSQETADNWLNNHEIQN